MGPRGGGLGAALLPEQVVSHLTAPIGIHSLGGGGSEVAERLARQLAHAGGSHPEQGGQLGVTLAPTDDELENCPLLGGKLVKSGHEQGEG